MLAPQSTHRPAMFSPAGTAADHDDVELLHRFAPRHRASRRRLAGASSPYASDNDAMTTVLGIDIGGTGIKGAPVDTAAGSCSPTVTASSRPHPATPEAVSRGRRRGGEFFDWTGPTGATFPAVMKDGVAHTAANVDQSWIGTDAGASCSRTRSAAPVTVVNDADAAGIAEMEFGAGKGVDAAS